MADEQKTVTFEHTREVTVKPFQIPNFAVLDSPPRPDTEGIPIRALPREALDELVLQWVTAVYQKVERRPPDLKWHGRGDTR